MRCPDIEDLIEFARQQVSVRDAAIVDHISVCEKCRHELRIINETLAADDWLLPEGSDDVGSVIHSQFHDDVKCHIKIAPVDTMDRYGRITIAAGEPMIVDPETKECVPATKDNIDIFKSNGMSLYINPNKEMQLKLSTMQNSKSDFGTALGMNMEALKGTAIPGYSLPWWVKLVPSPFTVNFRSCREIKIKQSDFVKHLQRHGVIPSASEVRQDVLRDIENANLFRVYELRGWGVIFHVYSIFVTHIVVDKKQGTRQLAIKPADVRLYGIVMDFVKSYKERFGKPNCKCFSIGSFGGWDKNLSAVELPDSIQVLSSPNGEDPGTWLVKHNSLEHMRPIYRTLVYRLYPESWATWHDRICEILKRESFECSMTVSRMAEISRIPSDCVAEVFEYLRMKDKRWQSVINKATGEMALMPTDGRCRDAGPFVAMHRKWPWFLCSALLLVPQALLVQRVCNQWKLGSSIKTSINIASIIWSVILLIALFAILILRNNLQRKINE